MTNHDTMTTWAHEAFKGGFFEKSGALKPAHKRETALGLAYAVIPHEISSGQLRALALAVRDIADQGKGAGALSAAQKKALETLAAEQTMPRAFREMLTEALPAVKTADDLDAFYGVLSGAEEAYEAVRATLEGLPT